jgi:hypothetical protein
MSEEAKRNCNTCKFGMFERCDTLKNNEQYQKIKDNGLFATDNNVVTKSGKDNNALTIGDKIRGQQEFG